MFTMSDGMAALPGSGMGMDLTMMQPDDFDSPDFDYGAFLQEQDIDYMAEESSASTNAVSEPIPIPQAFTPDTRSVSDSQSLVQRSRSGESPGASSSSGAAHLPKQRLERRGHTKSRRGCFNCKRRRIKVRQPRALRVAERG